MPQYLISIQENTFRLIDRDTGDIFQNTYPANRTKYRFGNAPESVLFLGAGFREYLFTESVLQGQPRPMEFILSDLFDGDGSPFADFDALLLYLDTNISGFNPAGFTGPGIGLTQNTIARYFDTQYTANSPLIALQNVPTTITNDGLGAGTDLIKLIEGSPAPWNTTTNRFQFFENQAVNMTILFDASPGNNNTTIRMFLLTGSGFRVEKASSFPLGAGSLNPNYFTIDFSTDADIQANDLRFDVVCSRQTEISNIRFYLTVNN